MAAKKKAPAVKKASAKKKEPEKVPEKEPEAEPALPAEPKYSAWQRRHMKTRR
jgi:hypothetical protein